MDNASQICPSPAVFARDGGAFTDSRTVAEVFDKRHADVVRSIRTLMEN